MTRNPDRLLSLSRRFTLLPAIAVLLAACLIFPVTVRAFDGSLELLQAGWEGTVAPGSWNPVKVRVTGGGADTTARLEVVLKTRFQPNPQSPAVDYPTGAYGQEVALPAGVAKEITLWVPVDSEMAGPGSLLGTVRLMAGDRLLAEQAMEGVRGSRTPYGPLVGALAESPAIARSLSQVELPVQGLPVALGVARLTASDIPAASERLRALGALVVQGNAASTLTGEQRRAVREWVASGGHLILAGGAEAARTVAVLPPDTLPVTFERSAAAADLSALARWAVAKGAEPGAGPAAHFSSSAGSPLAGTPDRPLAWRWALGQGTVTLFAADPSLEPLASWAGGPVLLRKALEPALPDPNENEKMLYIRQVERDSLMRMQGAVEAMPPEVFPSWWVVALLLGGFALVVGPLLHLLLWKRDRRGWVWVAVPAAALLLSAALYYTGIGRGGRDVLANVVAHVQLDPAGSQSRASLVAGFFAPTHPKLAVEVPGDVPVRVVNRFAGPYGPSGMPAAPSSEPPFRVLSGRSTRVEFDSGQWAMRSVALVRDLGQEAGKITARLGLESGLIKGTLRNDTPYPLEDAAVLIGQSLVKLGNLAPGQSVPVVLDPGTPPDPFRGGFPLSYRLFGQPVSDPASGGGGRAVAVSVSAVSSSGMGVTMPAIPGGAPERYELPQDPEVHRRVRLMDPIVNAPRPGPGMASTPLTFLAFTRSPVGQGLPGVGDHPVYHLALLEQRLQLEFPPGPFTIPASLIPAEVTTQSGGYGGGSNGTISWVQLQGGSMTCSFKLPLPSAARVEAISITTRQMGPSTAVTQGGRGMAPVPPTTTPTPAEPGLFSVYNWQSAAWEPLPGGEESARLAPASPHVGPEGMVRVQVTAGLDRAVQFIMPELTVEGTVAQ
ncbi:MAG: hypothetical protein ACYC66_11635 [Chloroflexota bacterium]